MTGPVTQQPLPAVEEIVAIAREAARIVMSFYEAEAYAIETKADMSPVTEADMAVNDYVCGELAAYGYPILSEESPDDPARDAADRVWIIDPIDGTKGFIRRTGDFAVMIGLAAGGKSVLGVVALPARDMVYWGTEGGGAWRQCGTRKPERLAVSGRPIAEGRLLVGTHGLHPAEKAVIERHDMMKVVVGSAGVKMCMIAAGEGEVYAVADNVMSQWDTCAAHIIVTEAGGVVTDITGAPLVYNTPDARHRAGVLAAAETYDYDVSPMPTPEHW